MNRRRFIATTSAAGLTAAGLARPALAQQGNLPVIAPDHPLQASWEAWKALCVAPDGRIIDAFQESASHSEGQGYGMALAAIFGDDRTRDLILRWTLDNLAVRNDRLLAWRWRPDTEPKIQDSNNASDGDLFFAWGLVIAGQQGNRPEFIALARSMMADVLARCTAEMPDGSGRQVLLPGSEGFRLADRLVINPSYYMPRAMREIAAVTGLPALAALADTGEELIASLAGTGLVPDWIALDANGVTAPPNQFSRDAGYEAMRVPLFALWSGAPQQAVVAGYARATAALGNDVTVFDPSGGEAKGRSPHAGYSAIAALAQCASSGAVGSSMPRFSSDQPYYPATLHLIALVVQATTYPRCVPI